LRRSTAQHQQFAVDVGEYFGFLRFQVSAGRCSPIEQFDRGPKMPLALKKYNRSHLLVWMVSVIDYCDLGFIWNLVLAIWVLPSNRSYCKDDT
jgi:hypothetical protein